MKLSNYLTSPEKAAIRDGFGQGLSEAAEHSDLVIGLSADLTESVRMNVFQEKFPERFIQVGVAEQNMIGVAAGLSMLGKIPFAASYAVFSPGRTWDQIRVSVCYSNLNVKIIGGHTGLMVGPDGATHQALEDIAILRVLPNMTVVVPCDFEEARKATLALAKHIGPAYLRTSPRDTLVLTTQETSFTLGKANTLREGSDATIIACGVMVAEALLAADELARQSISVRVINMHTIKPLDEAVILKAAQETGAIITAEEHQVAGGLGSAVAEVLSEQLPTPMTRVGMHDSFGESGKPAELLQKYCLSKIEIMAAVRQSIARK
ncbi:MAG: transketolase family protein [bacterium]|nr:transketolase family protein [bacterium]